MHALLTEAACALCGLPCREVPAARAGGVEERPFCCAGCRNVYAILLESGMVKEGVDLRETELFQRSLALGLVAAPAGAPAGGAGAWAGEADVAARAAASEAVARAAAANRPVKELALHVSGLWCGSCAWLIEHALKRERGVLDASVSFAADMATVRYDPMQVAPDRLRDRIEALGYHAGDPAEQDRGRQAEARAALLRLGIAAFCWLNVMMLNMAVYVGYFEKLPPTVAGRLPLLLMLLSAPAVFWCAWPILRLAGRGLVAGVVRTETLLALGILCAWGYSAAAALRGGQHVYFDTACAIVTLVLLGKRIEQNARERARQAVTRLYALLPGKARLVGAAGEKFVTIEALREGDVFLVKAGERFPADGRVVEGQSHADESMLTGESVPVAKGVGAGVVGGSLNLGGVLRVMATRVAEGSTLARIVAQVDRALAARSNVERMADRVTRVFVPAVGALAVATFLFWTLGGRVGLETALMRAVAVLMIACPCALGIAAPLAITAAVGAASRRGILVSDSGVLETVERVDVLVLDKTGTVTGGDVTLIDVEERHLSWLASLEANSEHPIGRAVVARAAERGMRLLPVTDVEVVAGQGIRGRLEGRLVSIGVSRLVGPVDATLAARAAAHERSGATVAWYGWDGRAQGLLALGSRIRPGAADLVREAQTRGIRVAVLSGDSEAATNWAAAQIGADETLHGVSPEEKAAYVQRLRQAGRVVAMVGDGVNDAPALAAADLGIAMGSGTDIAINAAAVTLTCNALPRVVDVFRLSSRTLRVVRQNLFWAFFYNAAGISLAATGLLHPILAAGAMVASSLCVIFNSTRLSRDVQDDVGAAVPAAPAAASARG